jgi:hypothetical protein
MPLKAMSVWNRRNRVWPYSFCNQNTKHYLDPNFLSLCSDLSTIPQHYSLNFSLTPLFLSIFLFTDFPLICTYLYLHMYAAPCLSLIYSSFQLSPYTTLLMSPLNVHFVSKSYPLSATTSLASLSLLHTAPFLGSMVNYRLLGIIL